MCLRIARSGSRSTPPSCKVATGSTSGTGTGPTASPSSARPWVTARAATGRMTTRTPPSATGTGGTVAWRPPFRTMRACCPRPLSARILAAITLTRGLVPGGRAPNRCTPPPGDPGTTAPRESSGSSTTGTLAAAAAGGACFRTRATTIRMLQPTTPRTMALGAPSMDSLPITSRRTTNPCTIPSGTATGGLASSLTSQGCSRAIRATRLGCTRASTSTTSSRAPRGTTSRSSSTGSSDPRSPPPLS